MENRKKTLKDTMDTRNRKLKLKLWEDGSLSICDSIIGLEETNLVLEKRQVNSLRRFLNGK